MDKSLTDCCYESESEDPFIHIDNDGFWIFRNEHVNYNFTEQMEQNQTSKIVSKGNYSRPIAVALTAVIYD